MKAGSKKRQKPRKRYFKQQILRDFAKNYSYLGREIAHPYWSGGGTLTRKLTTRARKAVKKGTRFWFLIWCGVTFRVKPRVVSPFEWSLERCHLFGFSWGIFWLSCKNGTVLAHRLAASGIFVKVGGSNLSSAFFCRSIGDELTPCDQDGRQEWKGVLENIFKVASTRSSRSP